GPLRPEVEVVVRGLLVEVDDGTIDLLHPARRGCEVGETPDDPAARAAVDDPQPLARRQAAEEVAPDDVDVADRSGEPRMFRPRDAATRELDPALGQPVAPATTASTHDFTGVRRWRAASASSTAAACDIDSDVTALAIGMRANVLHALRTAAERPRFSPPMQRSAGPRRST